MTKIERILLAAVAVALTMSAAGRESTRLPNVFNEVDQVAMNVWVDSVFNSLSPEARIGQLIIAAVTPSGNDATRELVRRLVTRNLVGGLIYENSSIADQAAVTNLAQSLATVPLQKQQARLKVHANQVRQKYQASQAPLSSVVAA